MSSRHVVKYRTRHKRLSDLSEEDTRHGFDHRIYVERSQTQPSDAVFCDVWDLNEPLTTDQHTRDSASYDYRQQVTAARAARFRAFAFADLNFRHPRHSVTTTAPSKRRSSTIHWQTHLRAPPHTANADPVETIPNLVDTDQISPITSYTRNDILPGITYESQCGKSPSYCIDSGRLPHPLEQIHSGRHPMAAQQSSSSAASHIPRKINANHIPRGISYEIAPVPNEDGYIPDNGFPYPGNGNELDRIVQRTTHILEQSTPTFYPIVSGGLPDFSWASSSLQQSWSLLPTMPSPSAEHALSMQQNPTTPYALPALANYPGQANELSGTDDREWYQLLQTTEAPAPSSFQFTTESEFSAAMSNVAQGGLPDFTYQETHLAIPTGNNYEDYRLGSALGPLTSISSSSYSSESMVNSGQFFPYGESTFYPQNGDLYESYLQNYDPS